MKSQKGVKLVGFMALLIVVAVLGSVVQIATSEGAHYPKVLGAGIEQRGGCKLRVTVQVADEDGNLSWVTATMTRYTDSGCTRKDEDHPETTPINTGVSGGKTPVTVFREVPCKGEKWYKITEVVVRDTTDLEHTWTRKSACRKCVMTLAARAPTLTEWGLIALGILLAGSLAWMIRRRVITRPTGA